MDGKEWAICTTTTTNSDGSFLVTTELVIRVKIENKSTIITDPNIVKAKSEAIKNEIERKGTAVLTYEKEGKSYTENVRTTVVLDYSPVDFENDGNIAYLKFDHRVKTFTTTSTTTVVGNRIITNNLTKFAITLGTTEGFINRFDVNMAVTVDGLLVPDCEISETGFHELFGHSGGLNHPWELKPFEKLNTPNLDFSNLKLRNEQNIIDNFLNSSEMEEQEVPLMPSGENSVDNGQIKSIIEKVKTSARYDPDDLKNKTHINHD